MMMTEKKHDTELMNIFFQRILDEIDAGVHVVDGDGKTVIYNRKMAEIEDMKVEEVLDKSLREVFSFEHNEDSRLLEAVQKGIKIENAKQTYYNNQGQEITTINHTIPIVHNRARIGAMEIARDVTRLEKLIRENRHHREDARYTFDSIIGRSRQIADVIEASKRATRTSSSVLIIGDTGTGKELFAQSIHNGSDRAIRPFISQNCAAIPDSLIEGILFGTKKGAFTGAIERPGLFEQAEGGTILLDEINSLDISLQAKLLRVLQEKTVRRVGDTKDQNIDVRIIATINEDPIDAIASGRLRKDLYYRLGVVSLFIPPLRERQSDIPDLIHFFIEKYNDRFGMNVKNVDELVLQKLLQHEWPGNVRELEHIIEGAMNLIEYEDTITFHHLPIHYRHKLHMIENIEGQKKAATEEDSSLNSNLYNGHDVNRTKQDDGPSSALVNKTLNQYLEEAEYNFIKAALTQNQHNITKTALTLGMSRQNLQYRIKKHNL
ncbi:sigma-54-dependent Fis family transcriptional regulator [Cytobacillus horneckiae]|uniref:Sigma-54-dependent Fis family transcriptional regulator n=2 Tax=Cytobacillus horneckiae TaxID=549687 RepID=A0A2N0Z8Q8_9BACI|nr:sigma 54-interacting transcriptional regulator [Cytobacillus horneckiae]MBN6889422.1 sigma 54-interacting transcriptional regulator [Cytobacillus horneckiae]MEC1156734.1 sigma 54-interacting transcriptional regulator [Cytobacillus horneckiae]MED2939045.1 sigma 54-interacting transcriptional regulator [Cytobacillus horneckiae]PKG25892.1 sigma-54-dependent Fis family transcriptional regulator [Cytobacillus horneckiae]